MNVSRRNRITDDQFASTLLSSRHRPGTADIPPI
jgi:hypothetical protein